MSNENNPEYWDDIYIEKTDRWNLNSPNPVFVQLLGGYKFLPDSSMLIIGSGKGFDAVYAAGKGFKVSSIDFSDFAVKYSKKLAGKNNVDIEHITEDLFNLKNNCNKKYDIIYEYVTICSLKPNRRKELLENLDHVLNNRGIFVTVLFPMDGRKGGPPYNVDLIEFYNMAREYWNLEYFTKDINSVKPRKWKEVLLIFRKGKQQHGCKS